MSGSARTRRADSIAQTTPSTVCAPTWSTPALLGPALSEIDGRGAYFLIVAGSKASAGGHRVFCETGANDAGLTQVLSCKK